MDPADPTGQPNPGAYLAHEHNDNTGATAWP